MKGDPEDTFEFNPVGSHSDGLDISSAQTLSAPASATKVLMQTIGQNVRYTLDGTTPTPTVGFRMVSGDPPILIPLGLNTVLKVIQESATADLQYQWGAG